MALQFEDIEVVKDTKDEKVLYLGFYVYYLRPDLPRVFIAEVFKKPIFNDVMEQELLKAVEWLKNKIDDKRLARDIEKVISELVEINRNLRAKIGIDSEIFSKEHRHIHHIFELINPEIALYTDFRSAAGNKAYASYEIKDYLFSASREMVKYDLIFNSDTDWFRFEFLHRVLLILSSNLALIYEPNL